jgi:hypothetical protein
MFIKLAQVLGQSTPPLSPFDVFNFHPLQLQAFLECCYEHARASASARSEPVLPNAGIGTKRVDGFPEISLQAQLLRVLQGRYTDRDLGDELLATATARVLTTLDRPQVPRPWHQLIYAFLIENTRALEVFARVLEDALHGERLGTLSEQGQRWLHTTEALCFRDQSFSFIGSIQSSIRPDPRATRRNAYYRMFGMDLNHGKPDGSPYPFLKAEAHNSDFVPTLDRLLREIWRGRINVRNTSGANTTDDSMLAELAERLQQMLSERRINGNLSREEYATVNLASWFHLTVAGNSPIVVDLQATAATPEERLRKLGERVGVVPHSKARALFELAEPLSRLLIAIELGVFNSVSDASLLYDPARLDNISVDTLDIINRWSSATGVDLKAVPVSNP